VDAGTHAERWSHDVAPDSFVGVVGSARFSPDGRRILFRYDATPGGPFAATGQGDRSAPVADRLWVARADGAVEHDFVLYEPDSSPVTGPGPGISPFAVVCSPDGRSVAAPGPGVVGVWDLDTETLRHRLTGHTGYARGNIGAVYNADGSRLFTVDRGGAPPTVATFNKPQIHVWDTASGRELLTLDAGDARGPGTSVYELAGEKLILRGPFGTRVLDGTPVQP
jgi:hypothetical protein